MPCSAVLGTRTRRQLCPSAPLVYLQTEVVPTNLTTIPLPLPPINQSFTSSMVLIDLIFGFMYGLYFEFCFELNVCICILNNGFYRDLPERMLHLIKDKKF